MHVACGIIIENGRVLLMRRAEGHSMAGKWEYPGGKLEKGESGAECVKRELKEELRIDAEIGELLGSARLELPDRTLRLDGYRVISYEGEIALTDHDRLEWVPLEKLTEHEQLPADLEISELIRNAEFGIRNEDGKQATGHGPQGTGKIRNSECGIRNEMEPVETEESAILKVCDWAYTKALQGVPGLGSAQELAEDYLKKPGDLATQVDELIKWQKIKCSTSGFFTCLGGFMTLPVSIPTNISTILYIHVRMIAAIAYMGGYDVHDERVRSLIYVCLCGNTAKDLLKHAGKRIGMKLTAKMIRRIPLHVLKGINRSVGTRLVTKSAASGLIVLGRAIPLAGGVVGGAFDYASTAVVGEVAKKMFITHSL